MHACQLKMLTLISRRAPGAAWGRVTLARLLPPSCRRVSAVNGARRATSLHSASALSSRSKAWECSCNPKP